MTIRRILTPKYFNQISQGIQLGCARDYFRAAGISDRRANHYYLHPLGVQGLPGHVHNIASGVPGHPDSVGTIGLNQNQEGD